MQANNPIDAIRFLLPALNSKEREELCELLSVPVSQLSACEKQGHKFLPLDKRRSWLGLGPVMIRLFCNKCGKVKEV